MTTPSDPLLAAILNGVRAISSLDSTLSTVFPQAGATSATASAGAATLPSNPLGFLVTNLPDGTSVKIPFYGI